MKRWWLWIVLLLSLGVNAGILATLALSGRAIPGSSDRPGTDPETDRRTDRERPWRPDGPLGGPSGNAHGEARILDRLADRLDLEGEERERFLDLQRSFFRQAFQARLQAQRLQRELGRELTAPKPDRGRIEELIGELTRTRGELDRALAETVLGTREVLDEPQEGRYLAFVQRLRERMGPEGPVRHRRGPPPGAP